MTQTGMWKLRNTQQGRVTFMQVGHNSVKFVLLQQSITGAGQEVGRPEETWQRLGFSSSNSS